MLIKTVFRCILAAVALFLSAVPSQAQTAFEPFNVVEIKITVKDYATWRKGFDLDSSSRKASGFSLIAVGRGMDKLNEITITLAVADLQKAKDFMADPRLKDVMEKNGVLSKPEIAYYKVVRLNQGPANEIDEWLTVTVQVKDFAAWLQVFDAEGPAQRASEGLIDVAIAQGLDDPNLIHLFFIVSDLAKAKASMLSEEKKKVRMRAGVLGPPKIEFETAGK